MKFCDAMEKLKAGSKVTREPWIRGIFFLMSGEIVETYQPKLSPYNYTESIMISDGWIVDGVEEELKFCDIVPYLKKGEKAKMKDWKYAFIYYDQSQKNIVIQSMVVFPFTPNFACFEAEDWVEIDGD